MKRLFKKTFHFVEAKNITFINDKINNYNGETKIIIDPLNILGKLIKIEFITHPHRISDKIYTLYYSIFVHLINIYLNEICIEKESIINNNISFLYNANKIIYNSKKTLEKLGLKNIQKSLLLITIYI